MVLKKIDHSTLSSQVISFLMHLLSIMSRRATMANKLSMSTKGYAKIERGETRVNIPRLEQISEIFDMDVCDLLAFGESVVNGNLNLTPR